MVATPSADALLTVTISLVFAIAENGVIGREGGLPWHLPADLKRFKALTTGHTIVMGRKTFQSIGRPLPNRRNVVLTRDLDFDHPGVIVAHNLADALSSGDVEEEIFVVGGAEVFRQTIPKADRVYQTLVHSEVDGDITFTEFDPSEWDLLRDEFREPDAKHEYPISFRLYMRRKEEPVSS